MSTLPIQPINPNQAAGQNMAPMSYAAPASPVAATVPTAKAATGTLQDGTGVGASTYGQPFGGVPSTLPTSGSQTFPSISSGLNTQDGAYTLTGDFKDTYGAGTGSALAGILGNLGTSANSAVQATNAQILDAASRQSADMYANQAAHGVSRDSSTAALAEGDFASQVNRTIATTDAGLEWQGLQTLISSLTQEGQAHGGDSSGWDTFSDVLGLGGSIAGAVSEGLGIGGSAGSILDVLSSI